MSNPHWKRKTVWVNWMHAWRHLDHLLMDLLVAINATTGRPAGLHGSPTGGRPTAGYGTCPALACLVSATSSHACMHHRTNHRFMGGFLPAGCSRLAIASRMRQSILFPPLSTTTTTTIHRLRPLPTGPVATTSVSVEGCLSRLPRPSVIIKITAHRLHFFKKCYFKFNAMYKKVTNI